MTPPAMSFRRFWLGLLLSLVSAPGVRADPPVPPNVLNPATVAEAWNVLRLASANVGALLQEKRLSEITVQASLCSPALRTLEKLPLSEAQVPTLRQQTALATRQIVDLAVAASTSKSLPQAQEAYTALKATLDEIAKAYDPKITRGDIYICPMHPDVVSENPAVPCTRCGMRLMTRRIPYSFIYRAPGESSISLTAKTDGPLEPGRQATVRIKLATRDGKPVTHSDLVIVHTQPIHLLIVDPSLGDYHHEHPQLVNSRGEPLPPAPAIEGTLCGAPRGVPGEYVFSFTPAKPGPYRIFADLVPTATGLQEYAFTDLPGQGDGGPSLDKANALSASAGGLQFQLKFTTQTNLPPQARQVRLMKIVITESDGSPTRRLQPVMNAFAHLVGFYDDGRTVVHLHPEGGDILREEARGGPTLNFKIYPPKAGFLRLYCQVLVDGRMIFAPFNLNVLE
ncbi:MAG: hypothetical protein U0984_17580 [Prosthecobacter sp.]|nr:hypothetical protein [Prosthecobacter sp.]